MPAVLDSRRAETSKRLQSLKATLQEADRIANGTACVYLTGSFARGEATTHSDLDLFIVSGLRDREALPRLDEICIKADLIGATRALRIPDFSGDGEYLVSYTLDELTGTLGKPTDDASNTFTARLLLLLESKPLLGEELYNEVIGEVLGSYWRDFENHRDDFVPAFLANDILRLWRTFCVNYEARTDRKPDRKKAKGKLKNLKLKHSRLLTCYSALVYLLAVFSRNDTVTPRDALSMALLTPTERLEWLAEQTPELHGDVGAILDSYDSFPSGTDAPEDEMVERFMNKETSQEYFRLANDLGDGMFHLLRAVGDGTDLYRLLVV